MSEKNTSILYKILETIGYDLYDAFIKIRLETKKQRLELKTENEMNIKKQILDNEDLSFEQKIAINAVLDKNLKSFAREISILNIALNNMDDDAKAENLDEDWILDFFDKASRISEVSTQLIWGKMLASSASDKRLCSKTLLNTLYLMGKEDITSFLNICRFVLSDRYIGCSENISSYPIIFFSEYVEKYNVYQLSTYILNRLQRLGLIEIEYKSEFVFTEHQIELIYSNHVIKIENNDKIRFGNVRFTKDGYILYQITDKLYDNSLLNEIIEIWRRRKYIVYIDGRLITR